MGSIYDERYKNFVRSLSDSDQGKILKYQDLFVEYGFKLPSKYLKKLDKNLWELRPGNVRLFLGKIKNLDLIVFIHGFKKKSQKAPKKDIKLAKRRLKEYEQEN